MQVLIVVDNTMILLKDRNRDKALHWLRVVTKAAQKAGLIPDVGYVELCKLLYGGLIFMIK